MERIGVRQLRQNASEYLRRVEVGEAFEVTDRGRPVAVLAPIGRTSRERLIAGGRLQPGIGGVAGIAPIARPEGAPSPSDVLERLREE